MSAGHDRADSQATVASQKREEYIQRFEAAWLAGQKPAIDDYLPPEAAERWAVLVELVHADLECRIKAGEEGSAETYLERYPELAADATARRDLLAAAEELRGVQEQAWVQGSAERRTNPGPEGVETMEAETIPPGPGPASAPGGETPAPSPLPAPPLQGGPEVPGYEILGELGRGGMGVVYKARQVALKRLVALKMILSGSYAGEAEVARFKSEAEAVARLQHPNTVQIYEIGEAEGRPFFSLEYVEGGSLDKKLGGTPLPAAQATRLVEMLARAMHAAHQRGIIHRDLKPANILLSFSRDPTGSALDEALPVGSRLNECLPKITDFGLAKQLDAGQGQTQSGAILGTPSYMAPEQAGGPKKEIGPATDVYALGAILYELLTGRPPFKAATPLDTLLQVVSEEPVPPSRLNVKVPRDLETVCLKCLEKVRAKRYASALDLADDLARYLRQEPVRARPIGTWKRGVKWVRRRPALASQLALMVLTGLALAAESIIAYRNTLTLTETSEWVAHSHQVLERLEALLSAMKDAETGQRGFVITGEKKYLAPYQGALKNINPIFTSVKELTRDSSYQQQRLARLRLLIIIILKDLKDTIEVRNNKGFLETIAVIKADRSKQYMDEARELIQDMQDFENRLLMQRQEVADASAQLTIYTLGTGIVLAVLLILLGSFLVIQSFVQSIRLR